MPTEEQFVFCQFNRSIHNDTIKLISNNTPLKVDPLAFSSLSFLVGAELTLGFCLPVSFSARSSEAPPKIFDRKLFALFALSGL